MTGFLAADSVTQTHPPRRHGATLVELAVSVTIATILMAGMASAMLIATRTLDNGTSPDSKTRESADVADQITADLNFAVSFSEKSSQAVTFTVPDRNADSNPETIRYAWSGVVGDPLTRQYNGGAPVTWAEDVRQFNLAYLFRVLGPPPPLPEVEGAEQTLISNDDSFNINSDDFDLGPSNWCAEYFKPTLPANTVHWRINRVQFMAKRKGGATESFAVEIRTADASLKPTTTVIDSVAVSESSLSNGYAWFQVSFAKLAGLDPAAGYCLVFKQTSSSGEAARIRYELTGSWMPSNAHWLTTNNGGSSWSAPNSTEDIRFFVYGTVTTQ